MRIKWLGAILLGLSGWLPCGCATSQSKAAAIAKPAPIRRIAVIPFVNTGGPAVTDEFIRQLVSRGVQVSQSPDHADAVIVGSVSDYRPTQKSMVFLGESKTVSATGETVVVSDPIVSATSANAAQTATFGLPNAQVVFVSAVVDINVILRTRSAGPPLWSDQFRYEGLDMTTALQSSVSHLVDSLLKTVPSLVSPS